MRKQRITNQDWVTVAVALACAAIGGGKRIATVEELARHLGYKSKQAVYDWMAAKTMKHVRHETVKALSDLSHVPIEWLTQ